MGKDSFIAIFHHRDAEAQSFSDREGSGTKKGNTAKVM
jgi:hypothetical protein